MSRSPGHCMVMGTASTMNSMAEALGMSLPGCAAIPAVDSRRRVIAQLTGRRIVEMVKEDLRISKILQRENFLNAVRANGALGGSTNAVIHLIAIAGRVPGVRVRARRLGPLRPRGADPGRHHAVGPVPDGGLLLRGRAAGGAARARRARPARQGCADGHRPDDVGQRQGRAELEHRGDPRLGQPAHRARRHGRSCAATSRPTARCSSPRPRRRR